MKGIIILFLFILPSISLSPSNAKLGTTTCREGGSPCKEFGFATDIFIGRVTKAELIEENIFYTVSVQQVFKGKVGAIVQIPPFRGIEKGPRSSYLFDCQGSFSFDVGVDYLVYSSRRDDNLVVSSRSRTRPLSSANTQEDLYFLRNPPQEGSGGSVFGHIWDKTDDDAYPFKLEIEGNGRTIHLVTDKKGYYEISGLKPGDYTIKILTSSEYYTEPLTTSLIDRGCSEENFPVYKKVKVVNLPQ